ncbi:hypothetical protein VCHC64A1_03337A, partial [Vibrio cholerae HC-64A1]
MVKVVCGGFGIALLT